MVHSQRVNYAKHEWSTVSEGAGLIEIRPMDERDVSAVHSIEMRSYSMPWSQSAFEAELGNRTAHYLVAVQGGVVVGYCGMWMILDEAHITTIAVDPNWRRRHIAERLLLALLDLAIWCGAVHATLEVRITNLGAQRLYERFGFEASGNRPKYYWDTGEDAVIMWAKFINGADYQSSIADIRSAAMAS